ncbi:MAG: type II toxin-antitoxin system RelE/ParE family toxin [bacterium]
MWFIERTEELITWIKTLDDDAKEAILKNLKVLSRFGPQPGRPYVDSVYESRHKNMKELRVQNKKRVYRIFFAFNRERKAVLLIGGDKRGKKKFYKEMIPIADELFDKYLRKMEKK